MNKDEFLTSSGLSVQTLEFWVEQQWLIPEETSAGQNFSDREIARARLVQNLKSEFGVNDEGIDVILHLLDQLHGLRSAFMQLHSGMRDTSG
ncbi:MAG: MerR family transcriptional regulator [Methylobacteriaceae bacterium]|nr:MerR family transcriptional regulator [Methylobacteriaceae bacterium]